MLGRDIEKFLAANGISVKYSPLTIELFDGDKNVLGNVIYQKNNEELNIAWISVDDKYANKGYGTLLLYFVIQEAIKLNTTSITLSSVEAAKSFYLKNCFVESRNNSRQMQFNLFDSTAMNAIENRVNETISANSSNTSRKRKKDNCVTAEEIKRVHDLENDDLKSLSPIYLPHDTDPEFLSFVNKLENETCSSVSDHLPHVETPPQKDEIDYKTIAPSAFNFFSTPVNLDITDQVVEPALEIRSGKKQKKNCDL